MILVVSYLRQYGVWESTFQVRFLKTQNENITRGDEENRSLDDS